MVRYKYTMLLLLYIYRVTLTLRSFTKIIHPRSITSELLFLNEIPLMYILKTSDKNEGERVDVDS